MATVLHHPEEVDERKVRRSPVFQQAPSHLELGLTEIRLYLQDGSHPDDANHLTDR